MEFEVQTGGLDRKSFMRLAVFIVIAILLVLAAFVGCTVTIAEGNRHKNERMWEDCVQIHTPSECQVSLRLSD